MKAILRLDPWLCGLEFLTFIWIEYNFLGWGLWFRPFLSNHNNFLLHFPHLNNESFALFLKNVCGNSREKWKESTRKRNSFGYPLSSPFFPQPSYLAFIPYLMKNLNHFGKKGLDKRHLVAIPTLALTFPLYDLQKSCFDLRVHMSLRPNLTIKSHDHEKEGYFCYCSDTSIHLPLTTGAQPSGHYPFSKFTS